MKINANVFRETLKDGITAAKAAQALLEKKAVADLRKSRNAAVESAETNLTNAKERLQSVRKAAKDSDARLLAQWKVKPIPAYLTSQQSEDYPKRIRQFKALLKMSSKLTGEITVAQKVVDQVFDVL